MKVAVITPPAVEPVSLTEAKDQTSIDGTDHNATLSALITAGRQYVEAARGVSLITQTLELYLDYFPQVANPYRSYPPSAPWASVGDAVSLRNPAGDSALYIELPRAPVQSVTSVTYTDQAGTTQTLSPTLYDLDLKDPLNPTIAPKFGQSWPSTSLVPNAVTVRYVAGYGDTGSTVPEMVKLAIKAFVAHHFENREASVVGKTVAPMPYSFDAILNLFGRVKI